MDTSFAAALLARTAAALAATALAVPAAAQTVRAGSDLFITPNNLQSWHDFSAAPLPAGTFGAQSDAFGGTAFFTGTPLADPAAGGADTIITRLADAPINSCPDVVTVAAVFRAVSLESAFPIRVTFNGGASASLYDVSACLSSVTRQTPGTMTLTRDRMNGGSFVSSIPVTLKLVFTRVLGSRGAPRVVVDPIGPMLLKDCCTRGLIGPGYWSYTDPFGLLSSPGGTVDHDCNPVTPPIRYPGTANFFPNVEWISASCAVLGNAVTTPCQRTAPGYAHDIVNSTAPPQCGIDVFCLGAAPANTLYLDASGGEPALGQTVQLRTSALTPGAPVVWGFSLGDLTPPLMLPFFSGALCIDPSSLALGVGSPGSAAGTSTLLLQMPNDQASIGATVYVQSFSAQGAQLEFSNGLQLVVCP